MLGLVGQKCGMTRVFTPEGEAIATTVIKVESNRIVQIKDLAKDGYRAVQVTAGTKRASKVSKPLAGHYAKTNVAAGNGLWEFRLGGEEGKDLKVGDELNVSMFKVGQVVDVAGVTKGKGFAGVMKRHHFSGQNASHGNSLSHRAPGSIGQRQTPGRVFKGKKMAGHLGDVNRTVQNLDIIRVDEARNALLVRGAIPGASGGMVIIKPVKERGKGNGA